MLKDLFFNIWYDCLGTGWIILVVMLSLFSIAILVFNFAYFKANNKSFHKKHLVYLCLIILILYQAIPVSLDFIASALSIFDIKKAIQIEQVAIKSSLIPWQKGCYYCKTASLQLLDKDYNKMYKTYDIAYKYLKSYKSPSWGISYLSFYTKGEYDKAIEIAKNWRGGNTPYQFISDCYLMKNDIKNAEIYIDKSIQKKESYLNIASKAYILKTTGNEKEAAMYYKKAKQLCKNKKQKNILETKYKNFLEYENNRLNILRKQQGLE